MTTRLGVAVIMWSPANPRRTSTTNSGPRRPTQRTRSQAASRPTRPTTPSSTAAKAENPSITTIGDRSTERSIDEKKRPPPVSSTSRHCSTPTNAAAANASPATGPQYRRSRSATTATSRTTSAPTSRTTSNATGRNAAFSISHPPRRCVNRRRAPHHHVVRARRIRCRQAHPPARTPGRRIPWRPRPS